MLKKHLILILKVVLMLLSLPYVVYAKHDKDPVLQPSPWAGTSANLGFTNNTGDSNTRNLNTAITLQYTHLQWVNTANTTYTWTQSNHVTNKRIYTATDNLSYYISPDKKTFLAANALLNSDYFSDYSYTLVMSAMYGRTLYARPDLDMNVQFGPGWRYNAPRYAKIKSVKGPVAVVIANLTWQPWQLGSFNETIRGEFGNPYNYYKSITSFTNKVSGHLALQISYQLDYYSYLPPYVDHSKKTNTQTQVSLVYNF